MSGTVQPNSCIPVLVIFAPTATGKTSLAEKLFAKDADSAFAGKAEVISADSMQVYRGMDIGTAKPDAAFLSRLPHHLIDIYSPHEQYGAGEFVRMADECCRDIYSRGKIPLVMGGTAFYIRNFMYGLPPTPTANETVRQKIDNRMKIEGADVLYNELTQKDPISAARIDIHDEYRIKRALEVYETSGKPLSSYAISEKYRQGYKFLVFSLERDREELYNRINERVIQMFDAGLVQEVQSLIKEGYTANDPGMQAIGYREFFIPHNDESDVVRMIQRDSRRYAKRQVTFFKPLNDVCHIDADDIPEISTKISDFFHL